MSLSPHKAPAHLVLRRPPVLLQEARLLIFNREFLLQLRSRMVARFVVTMQKRVGIEIRRRKFDMN